MVDPRNPGAYRPLRKIGRALAAFALMSAAAQCVMFVSTVLLRDAQNDPAQKARMDLLSSVVGVSATQNSMLHLGQMCIMLWWLRRAEANNTARGRPGGMNPRFMMVGFFIPLYGYLHRYLVAQQVWWCSGPRGTPEDYGPVPLNVRLWGGWGITTAVLGMVMTVMSLTSRPDALMLNAGVRALEACVEAMLLVSVVLALEDRQRREHERGKEGASVATLMGHVPDRPSRHSR